MNNTFYRRLAKTLVKLVIIINLSPLFVSVALAVDPPASGATDVKSVTGDLGHVAAQVTTNFSGIAKLITAGSYVAGIGFFIGAILKFKAHKDNPTQIPIGTPVALVFISAALLFSTSLINTTGKTIFGDNAKIAGIEGVDNIGAQDGT